MSAPSMGAGSVLTPPPPSVVPGPSGFYGPFSAIIQALISLCQFTTVEIVRRSNVRTAPYLPPTMSFDDPDLIECYLSGPKEKRGENGLGAISELKLYARYDTVSTAPEIDDQINYDGERYVISHVKRIPPDDAAGGVWKIVAMRG